MDGFGNKYPRLLLSKAVHKLLDSDPSDKFTIQVMITMYKMMTWEKKTISVFGIRLPNNFHSTGEGGNGSSEDSL